MFLKAFHTDEYYVDYDIDDCPPLDIPSLNAYVFLERGWRLNAWYTRVYRRNHTDGFGYITELVCELIIRTYLANGQIDLQDLFAMSAMPKLPDTPM